MHTSSRRLLGLSQAAAGTESWHSQHQLEVAQAAWRLTSHPRGDYPQLATPRQVQAAGSLPRPSKEGQISEVMSSAEVRQDPAGTKQDRMTCRLRNVQGRDGGSGKACLMGTANSGPRLSRSAPGWGRASRREGGSSGGSAHRHPLDSGGQGDQLASTERGAVFWNLSPACRFGGGAALAIHTS